MEYDVSKLGADKAPHEPLMSEMNIHDSKTEALDNNKSGDKGHGFLGRAVDHLKKDLGR